jgi:hypothetical protein
MKVSVRDFGQKFQVKLMGSNWDMETLLQKGTKMEVSLPTMRLPDRLSSKRLPQNQSITV